jgi:hypothetical protein
MGEVDESGEEWWRAEVERRLAAVRSGEMRTVSSEQVEREMEEIIARARRVSESRPKTD